MGLIAGKCCLNTEVFLLVLDLVKLAGMTIIIYPSNITSSANIGGDFHCQWRTVMYEGLVFVDFKRCQSVAEGNIAF